MKYQVRLTEEADRDLSAASSWYEQQQPGLGHDFLDKASAAFDLLAAQPLVYKIIHRDLRRVLMSRFPFGIYFKVEKSHVIVLAVIHGSRHPARWQRRT